MIPLVCCRPRTHQPHTMKYFGCTSARMRERRRHQSHSPGSLEVEKASKKTSHGSGCGRASHAQGGYCTVLTCPCDYCLRCLTQTSSDPLLWTPPRFVHRLELLYTAAKLQISATSRLHTIGHSCTVCSHQPSNQRTISRPRPHGQPLGRMAWICITGKPLSSWSWKCPVMMQCFCAAGIQ